MLSEPYELEDQRQAVWDMKCERAPKCMVCGESVYPHEIYMVLPDGQCLCEKCMDDLTHDTSDLEDLW